MTEQRARLRALHAQVGGFYVADRTMKKEQQRMIAVLESTEPTAVVDSAVVARYLAAVQRYFAKFHEEANTRLRSVDRKLESLAQQQFNVSAERGVAAKRVEITRDVLQSLAEFSVE